MSIWVSVYCRDRLGPIQGSAMEAGIKESLPDYLEVFDQDEDAGEVQA